MDFAFKYKPYPKQAEFHNSPAKTRVYCGGVGSGKTTAGVAECWQLSMEYPRNYGLVGRMTYPELRDTTWKELIEFPVVEDSVEMRIIDSSIIRRYDKNKMEIELVNGSIIIGRALEDSFDKLAKGLNLGFFYNDEMTETSKKMWDGITRLRLRRKVPCGKCGLLPEGKEVVCPECKTLTIRHTAFGTTNPEGHDWVWQDFVMNADENHFLVQASSYDNPALSGDYIKELEGMPDDWKKRYLYGSFDTFEGLVYKEFQDKEPHVIKPFVIPDHWQRYISLDHGYRNPTAILWGAVNEVGVLHIYDEFYASGRLVSEIASIIKAKSNDQKILQYLIDPSCRNRDGKTGRSIIDEFSDYGVYFSPANNAWEAGVNHVQEYIKLKDGKPKMKIFDNCVNLRTQLQTYRYKETLCDRQPCRATIEKRRSLCRCPAIFDFVFIRNTSERKKEI
jgi:phage terminase large subunit